ncbi:MAG TPA: hypothetical protein VKB79_23845 [Bryobacteraceae bacterium]|nr:hypothetical protein [Bryobacteraceae bacterium]
MARILYAAAPWWSGLRHRFRSITQAKTFADYAGYRLWFVWGVSEGVAYCRYEDILAPVPGVRIINVGESEFKELERLYRISKYIRFGSKQFAVYRPGAPLADQLFAFDLWGDFAETSALQRRAPLSRHPKLPTTATPSAALRRKADDFIRRHDMPGRVGIRVRVTENPADGRKPCRIQADLDNTIRSIIRMPWYTRVFLATDSEYVQQMLASHFPDARFWPKKFQDVSDGGRYVHRRDSDDMRTFMTEIRCLASCGKIVNVGGFMNEESLYPRVIEPPYDRAILRSPSGQTNPFARR